MLSPSDRALIETLSPDCLRALWRDRIGDRMSEEEIAEAVAHMIDERLAAEKEMSNGR